MKRNIEVLAVIKAMHKAAMNEKPEPAQVIYSPDRDSVTVACNLNGKKVELTFTTNQPSIEAVFSGMGVQVIASCKVDGENAFNGFDLTATEITECYSYITAIENHNRKLKNGRAQDAYNHLLQFFPDKV